MIKSKNKSDKGKQEVVYEFIKYEKYFRVKDITRQNLGFRVLMNRSCFIELSHLFSKVLIPNNFNEKQAFQYE